MRRCEAVYEEASAKRLEAKHALEVASAHLRAMVRGEADQDALPFPEGDPRNDYELGDPKPLEVG